MTEIVPRSADILWELAKDRKKIRDVGRDRLSAGVANNEIPHDLLNPPALEIF
jgi:hypothetical protein